LKCIDFFILIFLKLIIFLPVERSTGVCDYSSADCHTTSLWSFTITLVAGTYFKKHKGN
jgi:hypothetical protein